MLLQYFLVYYYLILLSIFLNIACETQDVWSILPFRQAHKGFLLVLLFQNLKLYHVDLLVYAFSPHVKEGRLSLEEARNRDNASFSNRCVCEA